MKKLFAFLLFLLVNLLTATKNLRRITHGTKPPAFTYPYTSQVRLELVSITNESFTCSGTIISELMVLTSAHCVDDIVTIDVCYASFKVNELNRIKGKEWFIHPYYHLLYLDIGLVVAERSFPLTSRIQAAYPGRWIKNSELLLKHSRPSVMCGWGTNEKGIKGDMSCIKYTRLDQLCGNQIINPEFNWCFYNPPSPDGINGTVPNACYGDSGGGIFPDDGNQDWKLFAVVSRISQNTCEGDGHTVAVQLTPNITHWILDKLFSVHKNKCSFCIES